jgi:hypothetical protein
MIALIIRLARSGELANCSLDYESFFDAVRDSIDALACWLPWSKPDYSIREARAWMEFASEAWELGRAGVSAGNF